MPGYSTFNNVHLVAPLHTWVPIKGIFIVNTKQCHMYASSQLDPFTHKIPNKANSKRKVRCTVKKKRYE